MSEDTTASGIDLSKRHGRRRRLLRFKLRTLLVGVVCFALVFWGVTRYQATVKLRQKALGVGWQEGRQFHVVYGDADPANRPWSIRLADRLAAGETDLARQVFQPAKSFTFYPKCSSTELAMLTVFPEVRELFIATHNDSLNGAIQRAVRYCSHLRDIHLSGPGIDDKVLQSLRCDETLEWLSLSGTKITDAGLANIVRFRDLKEVEISSDLLTSAGLSVLVQCVTLEYVWLEVTECESEILDQLEAMPRMKRVGARTADGGFRSFDNEHFW